jgi:hypothetical protein
LKPVHAIEASLQALATLDLGLEIFRALTSRIEFFLADTFLLRFEVRLLDFPGQPIRVSMADALAHTALNGVVDYFRQAAKLFLNGFSLTHENFQHPVLSTLRQ